MAVPHGFWLHTTCRRQLGDVVAAAVTHHSDINLQQVVVPPGAGHRVGERQRGGAAFTPGGHLDLPGAIEAVQGEVGLDGRAGLGLYN